MRKTLITLLTALAVAQAARPYAETNPDPKNAAVLPLSELGKCLNPAWSDKRFAPLREKSPHFQNRPIREQDLKDASRPTEQTAKLVSEFKSRASPCRQKFMDRIAGAPAALRESHRLAYGKLNDLYDRLARRDIAWGEANAAIKKIQEDLTAARERN
jgi:hypothetical protein